MTDAANAIFLIWFAAALAASALRIWIRILRYKVFQQDVPTLLWRDFHTISGLALPFVAVLIARLIGNDEIRNHPIWVLGTGLSASIGMTVFAYYEFFVIDDKERVIAETPVKPNATSASDPSQPEPPEFEEGPEDDGAQSIHPHPDDSLPRER